MPGRWRRVRAEGAYPCERRGHSATAAGTRIIIFGGNDHDVFLDDAYVLDLAPDRTPRWIPIPNAPLDMAPCRRRGHSATLVGNKIIVFGGVGQEARLYNDVHILDLDSKRWSVPAAVGGTPPKERYGHTATLAGDQIVVFGGCGDAVFNDLHVLDLRRMAWYEPECAGKPPSPRCGHTASLVGSRLVLFGGGGQEDSEAKFFSDTHLLDLGARTPARRAPPPAEGDPRQSRWRGARPSSRLRRGRRRRRGGRTPRRPSGGACSSSAAAAAGPAGGPASTTTSTCSTSTRCGGRRCGSRRGRCRRSA